MVERSRRRRGMYDITKTRMLMTTAVFAAVAAVFAGGANARIPGEDGSKLRRAAVHRPRRQRSGAELAG
jgi:hypothetical protein